MQIATALSLIVNSTWPSYFQSFLSVFDFIVNPFQHPTNTIIPFHLHDYLHLPPDDDEGCHYPDNLHRSSMMGGGGMMRIEFWFLALAKCWLCCINWFLYQIFGKAHILKSLTLFIAIFPFIHEWMAWWLRPLFGYIERWYEYSCVLLLPGIGCYHHSPDYYRSCHDHYHPLGSMAWSTRFIRWEFLSLFLVRSCVGLPCGGHR